MLGSSRPRPRRLLAVPGLALCGIAAVTALLGLAERPSWLGWCPPWLAAVVAAVLGVVGVRWAEPWTARRQRAVDEDRQALDQLRRHLGRQGRLPRIGQQAAGPLALRVHPAIELDAPKPAASLDRDLPSFVDRECGPELRDWMNQARTNGGFLLVVGDSSVGKTRLLYETARAVVPDFAVLAPDLGDGAVVNSLADAAFRLPQLIVWLDELQRFLPGPYLTPGSTPITAASVRRLLDAPTPVIIVGTLWPAHAADLRAVGPTSDATSRGPRHPGAYDVLTDRRLHEIRLDTFSDRERGAVAALATADPRLAAALADPDFNVTEMLAGARELVLRYRRATEHQQALIHAAVDAHRLGVHRPLSEDLLVAAARGYLTGVHADDSPFTAALRDLTSHERPADKATAPLIAVPSPDRRTVLGHTVADYLLQRLTRQRRSAPVPALAWQALTDHLHDAQDLTALARSATNRLLYRYAHTLYRRLEQAGDPHAPFQIARLLVMQGRTDEALDILRARADSADFYDLGVVVDLLRQCGAADDLVRILGRTNDERAMGALTDVLVTRGDLDTLTALADLRDEIAASRLVRLLAKEGRIEELRARADAHRLYAADQLADVLYERGDITELRRRAAAGEQTATVRLDQLLHDRGDIDELQARTDAGDVNAESRLGALLYRRDHSIDTLKELAAAGDTKAAHHLQDLLVEQGRTEELEDLVAAGHGSIYKLIDLYATQQRTEKLSALADAGDPYATSRLDSVLMAQGRVDEAITLLRQRTDANQPYATSRLVALLAEQGRTDELRAEVRAGHPEAAQQLIALLRDQGHQAEAERIRRYGLTPDGAPEEVGSVTLSSTLADDERL